VKPDLAFMKPDISHNRLEISLTALVSVTSLDFEKLGKNMIAGKYKNRYYLCLSLCVLSKRTSENLIHLWSGALGETEELFNTGGYQIRCFSSLSDKRLLKKAVNTSCV
jgi:hypothetical protein